MTTQKEHAELAIGGMTCDGCVRAVERRLKSLPGVNRAVVDLKSHSGSVEYDSSKSSPAEMVAAVEKLGYQASVK